MQLHSATYLVFLGTAWLAHLVLPVRVRWLGLLLASLVFYAAAANAGLLVCLAVVTAATWLAGMRLSREPRRTLALWAGIGLNVIVLVAGRVLPSDLWATRWNEAADPASAVAAIGVSFYTLQAIAYLVDVHRRIVPPEQNPGRLCLFLCFFPRVLQGPIERAGTLIPQFRQLPLPDYDDLRAGTLLIVWGYFKKVVVADRLAAFVDPVYGHVHDQTGTALLAATVLFAFQIYADFSGYTDLALGSARCFGVRLSPNFDGPYGAVSIAEFWRRWHMSLSSWLKDYLFMPITSWLSRRVAAERVLGVRSDVFIYGSGTIATMLLCGFWHGAHWTFIVWGGLHGAWLLLSVATRSLRRSMLHVLRIRRQSVPWTTVRRLGTFGFVSAAWIVFRASTLDEAGYVVSRILADPISLPALMSFAFGPAAGASRGADLMVGLGSTIVMLIAPWGAWRCRLREQPTWCRWSAYGALIGWTVLFATDGRSSFLYMRY